MSESNQKPCTNCRRRKVRCNKQTPCANCVRSNTRCVYEDQSDGEILAPLVLDKPTTIHLFDRLSGLEQMVSRLSEIYVKSNGSAGDIMDIPRQPTSTTASRIGKTIDFPFTKYQTAPIPPAGAFPSVQDSDMLIHFFLEVTEPFIRLTHVPWFQKQLAEYRSGEGSLYFETVLHCIHAISLGSLSSDFVLDFFRRPRDELLVILRRQAEEALSKADFMRTHQPMVLRGLLYFISFLFEIGDNEYGSSLLGVALRASFRIGLHHDSIDETPFVCDARRRIWLFLQYLDKRAANLLGVEYTIKAEWDTPLPKNAFDEAWETFRTAQQGFNGEPQAVIGYADTSFVLARATIQTLQDQIRLLSMTFEQMQIYINEQQKEIMRKYLMNSGSKTLQKFTVALLEIHIGAVYLTARLEHHKEAEESFRGQTFMAGIELLEQISALEADMEYIQYIWMLRSFVPIRAIVTVLTCTLFRGTPDCETRIWEQIEKVYARYDNTDCRLAKSPIFEPVNALYKQALEIKRQREMQMQT